MTDDFKKQLDDEVAKISKEEKCDKEDAFRKWVFDLLNQEYLDEGFSSDPSEIEGCLVERGLEVDFIFILSDSNQAYVVRADYTEDLYQDDIEAFFRFSRSLETGLYEGNAKSMELFGKVREILDDRGTVYFVFFSSKEMDGSSKQRITSGQKGHNFIFEIRDLGEIEERVVRRSAQPLESVTIKFEEGFSFEHESGKKNFTFCVSGDELRSLYEKHGKKLFSDNIREPLIGTKPNKGIGDTIIKKPEHFYYFNNGISAICKKFCLQKGKELKIEDLQIINGAQTLGALGSNEHKYVDVENEVEIRKTADKSEVENKIKDVHVLVKLTQVEGESSDFKNKIIEFSNTQNRLNPQDFRANDAIQVWLQDKFGQLDPKIHYQRKRPYMRKSEVKDNDEILLLITEFSKIMLTWLGKPWNAAEAPRLMDDSRGLYGLIFEPQKEKWGDKKFKDAIVAVKAFFVIGEALDDFWSKNKDEFPRIKLFKLFALLLFKQYAEGHPEENLYEKVLGNPVSEVKGILSKNFLQPMIDSVKCKYGVKEDPPPNTVVRSPYHYGALKELFDAKVAESKKK